jgi:hypothetical protein
MNFKNFRKISKFSFLCLFIILFIQTSCKIEIKEINDSNIDSVLGDGTGSNWLLMFYLDSCPHCKNANDVFRKISYRTELEEEDAPVKNLQIGKVECNGNNWACLRFNVTRVPLIVMLQNDKMFELDTYVTEDKLYNFIVEDKLVSQGEKIPPILGWTGIVFRIFEESVSMMNSQIQEFLDTQLQLNIQWNTNYTILLLINVLLIILTIEYMIVSFCFRKKVKPAVQPEKKEENIVAQLLPSEPVPSDASPQEKKDQ